MKVTVKNIAEFLSTILVEFQVGAFLFNDAVYVEVSRKPLNELGTSIEVSVQMSAIVSTPVDANSHNQYLLHGGEVCGIDRTDDDVEEQKVNGSAKLAYLSQEIEKVAEQLKLRIMPGFVSE